MTSQTYLHYMAYYVKHIEPLTTKQEYFLWFSDVLKTPYITTAPATKLKQLALHLYYRYIITTVLKLDIPTTITNTAMIEMIKQLQTMFDTNGIKIPFVFYDNEEEI